MAQTSNEDFASNFWGHQADAEVYARFYSALPLATEFLFNIVGAMGAELAGLIPFVAYTKGIFPKPAAILAYVRNQVMKHPSALGGLGDTGHLFLGIEFVGRVRLKLSRLVWERSMIFRECWLSAGLVGHVKVEAGKWVKILAA